VRIRETNSSLQQQQLLIDSDPARFSHRGLGERNDLSRKTAGGELSRCHMAFLMSKLVVL